MVKKSTEPDPADVGDTDETVAEGHPSADDYSSTGKTVLRTSEGYNFVSGNASLPVITPAGANMSREDADAVLAESDLYDGHVVEDIEEEGA